MEDTTPRFKVIPSAVRELRKGEKLPPAQPAGSRGASSLLLKMTSGLFSTYGSCDSTLNSFKFYKPKRFLTEPSEGTH